jgi:hypothetical protein|tara:strand:- start:1363 stop:1554 length:192 start_codon:yes stop_codon:yes gene_type:complete
MRVNGLPDQFIIRVDIRVTVTTITNSGEPTDLTVIGQREVRGAPSAPASLDQSFQPFSRHEIK